MGGRGQETRFSPQGYPGRVFLVGAGPGDPDLLTIKAAKCLAAADAVVYDRLIAPEILKMAPADAERIYVGKMSGSHCVPQERISDILVRLAKDGGNIVRLKGGDPFVFGRGSEEAEFLTQNGIPYEVIPGITAATGCTAAARIPLTHRGLSTGVRFVTGHRRGNESLDLNWQSLADPDTTLVVYMGLANVERITGKLIEAGLSAETPMAVIAEGTTPRQAILTGTLESMPKLVRQCGLKPPVLCVIGQVVAFSAALQPIIDSVTETNPPIEQVSYVG
jgi:uroporphyrin-III C-methyltransferase/precorrin-2 dehydrogenase/sirohydrochlorin ferrochelatase/uroporphyrin-III C-methyltransferase